MDDAKPTSNDNLWYRVSGKSCFCELFSPLNIVAGFKKTGIEPFNPATMFDCDADKKLRS